MRYAPRHLPRTMSRVGRGVAINTSRLPWDRSSASAVAEVTLTISNPIETMNALTPVAMSGLTKTASRVKTADRTA